MGERGSRRWRGYLSARLWPKPSHPAENSGVADRNVNARGIPPAVCVFYREFGERLGATWVVTRSYLTNGSGGRAQMANLIV
jgi:hypothetical protein